VIFPFSNKNREVQKAIAFPTPESQPIWNDRNACFTTFTDANTASFWMLANRGERGGRLRPHEPLRAPVVPSEASKRSEGIQVTRSALAALWGLDE
jgi:hypothetical protein